MRSIIGSTDCEAISNERASAKPAGDKQAKACLDSSVPVQHLYPALELKYSDPFDSSTTLFALLYVYANGRPKNRSESVLNSSGLTGSRSQVFRRRRFDVTPTISVCRMRVANHSRIVVQDKCLT